MFPTRSFPASFVTVTPAAQRLLARRDVLNLCYGDSARRCTASAQVDPFALRAEDVQHFCRLGASVGDGVRDACVELGRLARGKSEVLVAQGEAESAGDDVQPFMALVDPLCRRGTRTSARVRVRRE
jgi:hypothetical protein